MGISQDGYYACDYKNNNFQDYNTADIPASIHELYCEYGSLDSLDLSSTRVNKIFIYEYFHIENSNELDLDNDSHIEDNLLPDESISVREVRTLPFEYFRCKLVEHFDKMFDQKKLVWPKLTRNKQSF